MIVLDVARLFEFFGGPRGVLNLLDKHHPGHGLTYSAVQMWLQRKAIPGVWRETLYTAVERDGHDYDDFLIEPEEDLGLIPPRR